jgi:hypothetical protein
MKHLRAVNRKAARIEEHVAPREDDVVALQNPAGPKPHIPIRRVGLPDFASRWSATYSIVTSPAFGQRMSPII